MDLHSEAIDLKELVVAQLEVDPVALQLEPIATERDQIPLLKFDNDSIYFMKCKSICRSPFGADEISKEHYSSNKRVGAKHSRKKNGISRKHLLRECFAPTGISARLIY
jgi:hypothetical protein